MFKRTEIGKILLIVGILFLIDPLLQTLNFYHWYGLLMALFFGWLLTILGALLINLRVSAWTFFITAFYLYFISFGMFAEGDAGIYYGPFVLSIIILHILLGLIFGIASFLKARKVRPNLR